MLLRNGVSWLWRRLFKIKLEFWKDVFWRGRKTRENPPEQEENLAFHTEPSWTCHTFLLQDLTSGHPNFSVGLVYSGSGLQFKNQVDTKQQSFSQKVGVQRTPRHPSVRLLAEMELRIYGQLKESTLYPIVPRRMEWKSCILENQSCDLRTLGEVTIKWKVNTTDAVCLQNHSFTLDSCKIIQWHECKINWSQKITIKKLKKRKLILNYKCAIKWTEKAE